MPRKRCAPRTWCPKKRSNNRITDSYSLILPTCQHTKAGNCVPGLLRCRSRASLRPALGIQSDMALRFRRQAGGRPTSRLDGVLPTGRTVGSRHGNTAFSFHARQGQERQFRPANRIFTEPGLLENAVFPRLEPTVRPVGRIPSSRLIGRPPAWRLKRNAMSD